MSENRQALLSLWKTAYRQGQGASPTGDHHPQSACHERGTKHPEVASDRFAPLYGSEHLSLEQHTQRPTCKPHLSLSHHMNLSTCSLCHLQSQGSRQQQPCAGPQQHSHAALHIQPSRAWHCKVSLHRWCDHCGHCALSSTLLSCVGTAHCVWEQPQGAGSS